MPDPNMKILVVDDMSSMRRIIKNTLKQLGYPNTDEAEDGDKALEMVRNTPFDLVVSDWNMPNMNGLDLLKAIRQDPKLSALPVLMVTTEAEMDHILEAIRSGVNSYILKPFTPETMKEKIDKVFKHA
ncbi:MAG: chemotaxis response regulator CheY [Candidatus Manganitrophus sp.]|jgi:two-component system chemotaxis response regulator CheY|nr:chemotaxis response regulator CheY [Candidatus Manganitrophus sp.]WDT72398.1 MAG: chemotaxis response regulator CheY [Candidatus Manganitrophus sp.]